MKLTEGQLFTIEALNRIGGFEWPDKAEFAAMDLDEREVHFYTKRPYEKEKQFSIAAGYLKSSDVEDRHPDWRGSLISKAQFDSVDGWVRNDGNKPVIHGDFDLQLDDGEEVYLSDISADRWDWSVPCNDGVAITHWRYHKPTKANEMKQEHHAVLITDLLEQYTKKRNERERLQTEIECLQTDQDRIKDDENKLIEQIKQRLLQYGFEIRVIDENNEKPEPELVITDWRDLQIGDVVECITPLGGIIRSGDRGVIKRIDETMVSVDFKTQFDYLFPVRTLGVRFKFVRRP